VPTGDGRRRRAIVTGGAGFFGSHLWQRLIAEGWSVVCVDSLLPGARSNLERLARHDRFAFVSVAWAACRNFWKRAAASLRSRRCFESLGVHQLLFGDPDVCRRLGSRARAFADSGLRPERHLDALLDVYHAVER
jgi:NAD(P)-dependent dehydrogenase (short-subunit alcohol dehydrogenase family)